MFVLLLVDGVSLRFQGVAIPSDSFVDLDDIMYTTPDPCCNDLPSNTNPRDEVLLCVTDLVDCCDTPRTVRGDWYFPDGDRVGFDMGRNGQFQANRGPKMDKQFMVQFISIADTVDHQEEVVSSVSYPALLIPVLTRPSL